MRLRIKVGPAPSVAGEKYLERDAKEEGVTFYSFCGRTSLHGWKYLKFGKTLTEKVIWVLVLAISLALSGFFIKLNIVQFLTSHTRTTIETTTAPLTDIIFPSIYVCNVNQVTKSFLNTLEPRNTSDINLLFNEFLDGVKPGSRKDPAALDRMVSRLRSVHNWSEDVAFVSLSSQNCSEMLVIAEWNSQSDFKFYNAYQAITDYGTCCTMFPYLDFVNNETIPIDPSQYSSEHYHSIPRGAKNGVKRGMKLIIDVESFDYAYYPRGSRGVKVALKDARDKAVISQDGFYVAPGTETLVALIPSVINTTKNTLSRFDPDKRKCYQDDEFDLPNLRFDDGYRYSHTNCLYQAVIDKISENCSCMPAFAGSRYDDDVLCQGENLDCALYWINLMGNEGKPDLSRTRSTKNKILKCYQRCEIQFENIMSSSSTWPSEMFFYRTDFCYTILKVVTKICTNPAKRQVFQAAFGTKISCDEINFVYDNIGLCKFDKNPNVTIIQTNEKAKKVAEFLFDYARNNFAVLKIFINYPFYTKIRNDEAMTILTFVANTGGLLGLCLGMSFVSVFEIFYFFGSYLEAKFRKCC